ncbi:hypothetical protein Micbo1qcDRAFT_197557 [Microdochium bolleyi]|uniref:Uncharacterized protein n=1 Tax=Microdochium bolleyi TaxID=196109 RepID=A0A136ISU5_9PEZI|nr:hypothetical protein Micbo1qcDRAFT_197557 [Microdochium bolleyi]
MSRNNSVSSARSVSGAKNWIVNHMKEHHRSVNAAYNAYYGGITTPSTSTESTPAQSRKNSSDAPAAPAAAAAPAPFVHAAGNERPSYFDRAIKAAKKHHKSTNAAYASYYGMGVH